MPSVRYYNQSAPFWDFVASMENQVNAASAAGGDAPGHENERSRGCEGAFPFDFFQPRSGRHSHHGPHHGRPSPPPPPPPPNDGPMPPPPHGGPPHSPEAGPSQPHGSEHQDRRTPGGPRGHCGGRGGWGGKGRGFPFAQHGRDFGGPFGNNLNDLAQAFQEQLFGGNTSTDGADHLQDFKPSADVFDTPEQYTVHLSLPGAKKEDVAVSWDAEKSELTVSGVIFRPGNEELLKTLALDERKEVGAFERKVRLGSRANPAAVDVEGISAKLEDGILRVEVPKLGDEGFVEVKKVEVE